MSIKVSLEEKQRLQAIASERQSSVSALIREGIHNVLESSPAGEEASCYELMAHILDDPDQLGSSGLRDLSTDKSRLKTIGKK
ncbi:hypothetical protein N9230_01105 [Akkermansiaceae bacterium]|nr:hypothetical protein [Akkermansiaceae bacterium]